MRTAETRLHAPTTSSPANAQNVESNGGEPSRRNTKKERPRSAAARTVKGVPDAPDQPDELDAPDEPDELDERLSRRVASVQPRKFTDYKPPELLELNTHEFSKEQSVRMMRAANRRFYTKRQRDCAEMEAHKKTLFREMCPTVRKLLSSGSPWHEEQTVLLEERSEREKLPAIRGKLAEYDPWKGDGRGGINCLEELAARSEEDEEDFFEDYMDTIDPRSLAEDLPDNGIADEELYDTAPLVQAWWYGKRCDICRENMLDHTARPGHQTRPAEGDPPGSGVTRCGRCGRHRVRHRGEEWTPDVKRGDNQHTKKTQKKKTPKKTRQAAGAGRAGEPERVPPGVP